MTLAEEFVEKVKKVYLGPHNCKLIWEQVEKQMGNSSAQVVSAREQIDIQNSIFHTHFTSVYNNVMSSPNGDLQTVLNIMNNLAFQSIIAHIESQNQKPDHNLQKSPASKTFVKYDHFFSKDSELLDGTVYSFNYALKNVKSVNIQSLAFYGDFYNIDSSNDEFTVTIHNNDYVTRLQHGYYNINDLIKEIESKLEVTTKIPFHLSHNKQTNRIIWTVDGPQRFTLRFSNKESCFPLNHLLGMNKLEYVNNNRYIGETPPMIKDIKNLYMCMMINEKAVGKYETSHNNYCYFEKIRLNPEMMNSKWTMVDFNDTHSFVFSNPTTITKVSFSFHYEPNEMPVPLHFETVLELEYLT